MTAKSLKATYNVLWWVAMALSALAIALSLPVQDWLSRQEGRLVPVVAPAVLSRVEPDGETHSRVWGSAVKVRDCDFVAVEWSFLTDAGRVRVDLAFEDRGRVRRPGPFDFGPWRVQLPPDVLRGHSVAYVVHRCHPGWPVRSLLWGAAR